MTILFDGAASSIGAGPWSGYLLGPWGETSWRMPDNNEVAGRGRDNRRCELVQDPLGVMGQVIKNTLLTTDGAALSGLPTSRRSELAQTSVLQDIGSTYWIKVNTLLPADWVIDNGLSPTVCWQMHDTLDAGDAGHGPPFEFEIDGPLWSLVSRSATSGAICTGSVTGSVLTATTMQSGAFVVGQKVIGVGLTPGFTIASFGTGTGANNGGTYNLSGSPGNVSGITLKAADNTQIVRYIMTGKTSDMVGKWQSWVMKATWGFVPGVGALTIWRNRRRIFEESGVANAYGHYLGDFPALGTYNPVNWPQQGTPDRMTYNTGMVIGDAAETFLSFTGAAELERVTPIRLAAA